MPRKYARSDGSCGWTSSANQRARSDLGAFTSGRGEDFTNRQVASNREDRSGATPLTAGAPAGPQKQFPCAGRIYGGNPWTAPSAVLPSKEQLNPCDPRSTTPRSQP